ncbi:MAG: BrnT family toxin [Bryobacteraceae bacterium]|nr:BrnT family toxin [Bryobacteraceae bacterium]
MAAFVHQFEWDSAKASSDLNNHGVNFERAAEVFRDALALTIADDQHSVTEVRWITMGKDLQGRYMVVVHTFEELDEHTARIRIISARRPTRVEIDQYEEQQ